jgi:hypothetical protein
MKKISLIIFLSFVFFVSLSTYSKAYEKNETQKDN